MTKTKTLVALALLTATGATVSAQSIVVDAPSGETAVLSAPLTLDTKMTFSDAAVSVINGDKTDTWSYDQILRIRFEGLYTGISDITAASALRIAQNPVGDILRISGYDGAPASLAIFSGNGLCMTRISGWNGSDINVSSFAPGLYFVSINSKSLKFIKK